jgi:hypothetical protein
MLFLLPILTGSNALGEMRYGQILYCEGTSTDGYLEGTSKLYYF